MSLLSLCEPFPHKNIRITVPAGIANGQTIKLRGHGAPGINGSPAGDLYITFVIAGDPVFKRRGNNLHIKAPLNLYTAIPGGEESHNSHSADRTPERIIPPIKKQCQLNTAPC